MHEQYMNFSKPPKKSPTDTLHRESEKMNENTMGETGLRGELKRYSASFQLGPNPTRKLHQFNFLP